MTKSTRALTFVQKRIAEVRAHRDALLERAIAHHTREDRGVARERSLEVARTTGVPLLERALFRGEVEPEVVVAEDGTVRLAPLEWATEVSDAGEQ